MNTTNWLFLAGAIVIAGKWARGEDINPKTVIAIVILTLMITVLDGVDPQMADAFTVLILVAVALGNLRPILSKLNISMGQEGEGSKVRRAFGA